jgi:hypothetical protein
MFENVPTAGPSLSLADLEAHDPQAPARDHGERRFLCPLAGCSSYTGADHRALSLNVDSGEWYCHRCRAGGQLAEHRAPRIVQRRDRSRAAAARAFRLAPAKPPPPSPDPAARWRQQWDAAPLVIESDAGVAYLDARGIPLALALVADVRWAASWAGRPAVLFPIVDRQGVVVAVNGRYVDGRTDPKTRTYGPKSQGVFVAPNRDALRADPLVITEAPLDALALAACGVPAIALVGTTAPAWLPLLGARNVLMATDNDPAGEAAAVELARGLRSLGVHCERLRPVAKDWSDELAQHGPAGLCARLEACGLVVLPEAQRTEDERWVHVERHLQVVEAPAPVRCWWHAAPWHGNITETEFRAIIGAYVDHYGYYSPDLPEQEPAILRAWPTVRQAG